MFRLSTRESYRKLIRMIVVWSHRRARHWYRKWYVDLLSNHGIFDLILNKGGPAVYIWGNCLLALIHLCVGASLGELASAYPNAGMNFIGLEREWLC